MPPNDLLLAPARPAFQIDGRGRTDLSRSLVSLSIAEDARGLYRCEAVFGNWGERNGATDFLHFDRSSLEFGKAFVVKLGLDTLFTGRIFALEGRFPSGALPEIAVLADDRLQDLRMTRRTRTFSDVSDADVLRRIASDHGLTAEIDVPGPQHRMLAQVNQTDLAFARERAGAVGGELWVTDAVMHARSRADRSGAAVSMTYGERLREFRVLADLAHQRTSVTVTGWDSSNKQGIAYQATSSILAAELGTDEGGGTVLSRSMGDRREVVAHVGPFTTAEAQARAESILATGARQFVTGFGVADTDARLRAGSVLDLHGLGPLFSGRYYLSAVKHLFDAKSGLRTEFVGERPGLGRAS